MSNLALASAAGLAARLQGAAAAKPNIVLLMTDDQGWGQTGYAGHPLLKTPSLDAMADSGLRLDRFYAAAPVCSPTRASVLTGRSPDRCGVLSHGYALRLQERTLAAALRQAGYATGHFGKWHLDGLKGPGVPVLADDPHSPGAFGFDEWLSMTNFFDRDPLMSRKGAFVEFKGDPSEIIVHEALAFIGAQCAAKRPFFAVIWTGSPHSPFDASAADEQPFASLSKDSRSQLGELAAFDRSVGNLRRGLRELGAADETLVWYCSDNGGLPNVKPSSTGGLRGFKGSLYEGGLRVPCIIEWPSAIRPRTSSYPASTMDIFPTLADLLGLPDSALLRPTDGASIKALFTADLPAREKPIPFRHGNRGAWLDNSYKLISSVADGGSAELYDLSADPSESRDLAGAQPARLAAMQKAFLSWNSSVEASLSGQDYAERRVREDHPEPRAWSEDPRYAPYLEAFGRRPEYRQALAPKPPNRRAK
jgi:arylsulfatase A-like enzyme